MVKTSQELRDWIAKSKDDAWSYLRQLNEASPDLLHAFGYGGKSNAEAMQLFFQMKNKEIEKVILKWERDNPD